MRAQSKLNNKSLIGYIQIPNRDVNIEASRNKGYQKFIVQAT